MLEFQSIKMIFFKLDDFSCEVPASQPYCNARKRGNQVKFEHFRNYIFFAGIVFLVQKVPPFVKCPSS